MNLPSKVCLGAGVFLVLSGGLLALTGFALGARTSRGSRRMCPTPILIPRWRAGYGKTAWIRFPDWM